MAEGGSKKKVANGLVAMSSAAVLAVYAAGYTRTRSAAQRLEQQSAERVATAPNPVPETLPTLPDPAPPPPVATVAANSPREAPVKPHSVEPSKVVPAEAEAQAQTPESTAPLPPSAPPVNPAPVAEQKVELIAPAPAPPPPPAPAPAPAPPAPTWKDGTYTGWGSSRHGDIQASVVITGGRIESATIAQCRTRYSCSVIEMLPPEVHQRQSPEVDYVSGATQSANAFYYAVVEALNKAK